MEGNFQTEKITPAQFENLEKLVLSIAKKYKIPATKISGHKDHAETTCPGETLHELLPRIRKEVAVVEPTRVKIRTEQLFTPEYKKLVEGKRVKLVTNHTGFFPMDSILLIFFMNTLR